MKRILFLSFGIVLLVGCASKRGPNGSVSGKITYNGKPVNGAVLQLHPSSGEGNVIKIGVSQDGMFQGADIPPGEYKIAVEGSAAPPDAMKMPEMPKGMDPAKAEEMKQKFQQVRGGESPTIKFPDKYKNSKSTDLSVTISQGKKENLDLVLKD